MVTRARVKEMGYEHLQEFDSLEDIDRGVPAGVKDSSNVTKSSVSSQNNDAEDSDLARTLRAVVHIVESQHKGKTTADLFTVARKVTETYQTFYYDKSTKQRHPRGPTQVANAIFKFLLKNGVRGETTGIRSHTFLSEGLDSLSEVRRAYIRWGKPLPLLKKAPARVSSDGTDLTSAGAHTEEPKTPTSVPDSDTNDNIDVGGSRPSSQAVASETAVVSRAPNSPRRPTPSDLSSAGTEPAQDLEDQQETYHPFPTTSSPVQKRRKPDNVMGSWKRARQDPGTSMPAVIDRSSPQNRHGEDASQTPDVGDGDMSTRSMHVDAVRSGLASTSRNAQLVLKTATADSAHQLHETQEQGLPSSSVGVPFADSTDFRLDNTTIKKQMDQLFYTVQSTVRGEVQAMPTGESVDASFNMRSDASLRQLYSTVFGPSTTGAVMAKVAKILTPTQLTVAISGAFFYLKIFNAPPIFSFETWRKSTKGPEELEAALDMELGAFSTSSDALFRRAFLRHLIWLADAVITTSKSVQHSDSHARTLSMDLAHSIHQHLYGESLRSLDQGLTLQLSDDMMKIVRPALLLRCRLGVAREKYCFLWPTVGDGFDIELSHSLNGSGDMVAACLFPGIRMLRDEEVKVICESVVLLEGPE